MTFRADTAGFCDISSGTTGRLEGYRPGCRNSLIPANGVLNSPNFAEGCICGYPLFTSLAMVHRPDAELWTYNAIELAPEHSAIDRLGVNFGAPGDRMSEDETLWIDFPSQGGTSPSVDVTIEGEFDVFRQHSAFVERAELPWVAASGVEGVTGVTIPTGIDPETDPVPYTIRLHFVEPNDKAEPVDRVFQVIVQDELVADDFDIVAETGGPHRGVTIERVGVPIAGPLRIELNAKAGQPVLSGLELIAESAENEEN